MPVAKRREPTIKPYWTSECGRAVVYVGDCREVMAAMEPEQFYAVVTDPPYGLEFMGKAFDTFRGAIVDAGFCHWFAGFTDGEGCFSVHKKSVNGYETYDCQFSITLRSDDKPILQRIQRQLRIGTIADRPETQHGHSQTRYCVSAKAECAALRDLFRAFPLRAKKAVDFEHWSDALDAWLKHEPGEWTEMKEARERLMSGREFTSEGVRVDPFQMWSWRWGREALRVAKPGAHLLSFGGTRTWHRMTCAVEDAGWEIRDTIMYVYGSGFPKSHDVSKAIDKMLGAVRGKVGESVDRREDGTVYGIGHSGDITSSEPITDEAKRWSGWGTALKPAYEPVILARKPMPGTVAQCVLDHGTGGLNIDGCRVGTDGGTSSVGDPNYLNKVYGAGMGGLGIVDGNKGRWPANFIHDGSEEVVGLFPYSQGNSGGVINDSGADSVARGKFVPTIRGGYGGDGGGSAARYFYTAKADDTDRPHGKGATTHPTVKPLDLMRYLVRLVCAPGGRILDPFMGSGSTGCAAIMEGMAFTGVEQSEEYADIAIGRIKLALHLMPVDSTPPPPGGIARPKTNVNRETPPPPKKLRG